MYIVQVSGFFCSEMCAALWKCGVLENVDFLAHFLLMLSICSWHGVSGVVARVRWFLTFCK